MNTILLLGLLVLVSYLAGKLMEYIRVPKIIGYIFTGIAFSPHSMHFLDEAFLEETQELQSICLGFIAFAIGGELKWYRIRAHEKEIVAITLLASLLPFLLIAGAFFLSFWVMPDFFPGVDGPLGILAFSILLATLASPTDPTATLAVIHQYRSKGNVKDTILGVAALDDGLGILLFSVSTTVTIYLLGDSGGVVHSILEAGLHIGGAILVGFVAAHLLNLFLRLVSVNSEGQWIVFIFSVVAICFGFTTYLGWDALLACLVMGLTVANTSIAESDIFRILERYTEELIFLFFFVISGLHLDIRSVPAALAPILLFVGLRTVGKYGGSYWGGAIAGASENIRKYTAGGLIPQGGIVIGLALIVTQNPSFDAFSELLLTVVMGATVIHEVVGPLLAEHSLRKAGEIEE